MENIINDPDIENAGLQPNDLRTFFVSHLNKIYCAKRHLSERLPELARDAGFSDLHNAILFTSDDVLKQVARLEEIYLLLNEAPTQEDSSDLVQFIDAGFNAILRTTDDSRLRDLSILSYLAIIENIEATSFRILQMAAVKFPLKEINQLLKENFEEATADKDVYVLIASKYFDEV